MGHRFCGGGGFGDNWIIIIIIIILLLWCFNDDCSPCSPTC
ncbi:hypothetical protein SOV_10130 [Sporomusa ovata DSM 2662]|nr:hypothetical protein SOV_1c03510 [Sporomusa ovata DSM 2662]